MVSSDLKNTTTKLLVKVNGTAKFVLYFERPFKLGNSIFGLFQNYLNRVLKLVSLPRLRLEVILTE